MREEFTLSDMQIYGAEDANELDAILDVLDRANGETGGLIDDRGADWARVRSEMLWAADAVELSDIPTGPGVYVWFRDDEPIYVGEARGKRGLRGRLRAHLAIGQDLSRSTFRASVAVRQLGVDRATARLRPSVLSPAQVAIVNEWIAECDLAWVECASQEEAHNLEIRLRWAWLPPFNIL